MLGGSSSNNLMIYARGAAADYHQWDSVAPGWNWPTALHYFKKSERNEDPTLFENPRTAPYHSSNGEIRITTQNMSEYFENINEMFLNSFEELGLKRIPDLNGPDTLGVTRPHFTFADGRRSSTAEAFLLSAQNRPNLKVAKYTIATNIKIDPLDNRAYGVALKLVSGVKIVVYAKKEVILSAGAIGSPKLLMLSGIGPEEELTKLNIHTLADLPVGRNLQDHALVPIVTSGKRGLETAIQIPLSIPEFSSFPTPMQTGLFKLNENTYEISGQSHNQDEQPSHQIFNLYVGSTLAPIVYIDCRIGINYNSRYCYSFAQPNTNSETAVTAIILLHPYSRGNITLSSTDPSDDPIIHMNYLSDERDLINLSKGVKHIAQLSQTSYFKSVGGQLAHLDVPDCEEFEFNTEDYWICYTRYTVSTILHLAGTCSMGEDGVVDSELRVHGIKDLRVVDASVMPFVPSGNTNAPTIMIAERASDLIKLDHNVI